MFIAFPSGLFDNSSSHCITPILCSRKDIHNHQTSV
jgi:hypothetical protein